jgi:hypothetical protein
MQVTDNEKQPSENKNKREEFIKEVLKDKICNLCNINRAFLFLGPYLKVCPTCFYGTEDLIDTDDEI